MKLPISLLLVVSGLICANTGWAAKSANVALPFSSLARQIGCRSFVAALPSLLDELTQPSIADEKNLVHYLRERLPARWWVKNGWLVVYVPADSSIGSIAPLRESRLETLQESLKIVVPSDREWILQGNACFLDGLAEQQQRLLLSVVAGPRKADSAAALLGRRIEGDERALFFLDWRPELRSNPPGGEAVKLIPTNPPRFLETSRSYRAKVCRAAAIPPDHPAGPPLIAFSEPVQPHFVCPSDSSGLSSIHRKRLGTVRIRPAETGIDSFKSIVDTIASSATLEMTVDPRLAERQLVVSHEGCSAVTLLENLCAAVGARAKSVDEVVHLGPGEATALPWGGLSRQHSLFFQSVLQSLSESWEPFVLSERCLVETLLNGGDFMADDLPQMARLLLQVLASFPGDSAAGVKMIDGARVQVPFFVDKRDERFFAAEQSCKVHVLPRVFACLRVVVPDSDTSSVVEGSLWRNASGSAGMNMEL